MNAPIPLTALRTVTLDDKYVADRGRVFINAVQALVRLPILQHQRDKAIGLNTGGFISGYRGSPLGGVDQALWAAAKHLDANNIQFQPGVNEDLAATAVWGSQQIMLNPAKVDGLFSMWYGKAPGVDRSIDPVRHANAAGTSANGGVLMVIGDDHGYKSSTLPNQSDQIMSACMIPLLYPANVQEYLDFGLHGWAMSRFTGLWVGFKCVTETLESAASVDVDPLRVQIRIPSDVQIPPGGLNLRWPDPAPDQEARLLDHKIPAAHAYARANGLDRVVLDAPQACLGIVCAGKSYLDVREALDLLGIDEQAARALGLRVYKLGMVWPVEPQGLRAFAQGLEEILVVEEKRSFIEAQLKELLYDLPGRGPRVVGKFDERGPREAPEGQWLLAPHLDLSPLKIANALQSRLERLHPAERTAYHRGRLPAEPKALAAATNVAQRIPYFCSGCPHNTSTVVPEGSRAIAGIGCHAMVNWMDRRTATFTHMGGEGVPWIGQARFSKDKHVFANLGDGTYFHSGYMAVRAAVAARVPITYKILFNDAVAMTGGQQIDGQLTVPQVTRQMAAEGVTRIAVVTDEPEKYDAEIRATFAPGVTIHHRDTLDAVQRELREFADVSVLVYDQTCASEKRRRRKRGTFPDPQKRVVINELVCEGCGDCSVQSNCLSVEPLETPFGRKRTINQSTCNKDYSCVKGFCPSFVTIEGGELRKPKAVGNAASEALAEPPMPPAMSRLDRPYEILVTGVGGTGVVTIGALLGMAAHLEGRGVSTLDMTGLAQKGGAVMSHVRLAETPESLHGMRVPYGGADLLMGGDLLVSASPEALSRLGSGRTRAIVNTAKAPTAEFVKNPDWRFPEVEAERAIAEQIGPDGVAPSFIDARALALPLLGDAIYANPFMLGFAFQKGWLPLRLDSLLKAIELNAVSVERNTQAFNWGRRAAHDLQAVVRLITPAQQVTMHRPVREDLDAMIANREAFLTDYQNAAYAARYRALVDKVRNAESQRVGGTRLTESVARYAFKLMAYKDEYEVARLYTDTGFRDKLESQFEGKFKVRFHLAPPALNRSGEIPAKRQFGAWMGPAMQVLAKLRFLRGTHLDPFGRNEERRIERRLVTDYERLVDDLAARVDASTIALALELARIPEQIRGYGHVKMRHLEAAQQKQATLMARWQDPGCSGNEAPSALVVKSEEVSS